MRRALVMVSTVAMLAVSGCAATVVTPTSSTERLPTTTSASTTTAAPTSMSPLPVGAPIAAATTVSGYGSATVQVDKPAGTTAVIATISGGSSGHHFGVRALDGTHAYLVETEGAYQGSMLLDADGGTTTQLYVFASRSSWTITLSDPRTAQVLDAGTSGSGDTVFTYQGPGGRASVSGGAPGTYFAIRAYGAGALNGSLVSVTAPYDGQVGWRAGVALISVRATGPWSISLH